MGSELEYFHTERDIKDTLTDSSANQVNSHFKTLKCSTVTTNMSSYRKHVKRVT